MGKFKTGDKIKIRNDLTIGQKYGGTIFQKEMEKYKGKTHTIYEASVNSGLFTIKEAFYPTTNIRRIWTDEMFEIADIINLSGKLQVFIEQNNLTEEQAIEMLEWHLK